MKNDETKKTVSIKAIDEALENAPGIFAVKEIAAKLGGENDEELIRRIEHLIDSDTDYFHDDEWNCELKARFFSRIGFAMTPDAWEIREGVLFPGGRLTPFLSEEIFPSDAVFLYGGREVPKREITLPFSEAMRYSILLGQEQVINYFEADSDANDGLRYKVSPTVSVTLTVFDLGALYNELDFEPGDALIARLTDPEEGVFELTFRPRSERPEAVRGKWILDYEKAMTKVVEHFRDYLEIPDQIAWAFYYGGEATADGGASVEEFISESDRIEIRTDGDHAVLSLTDMPVEEGEKAPGTELPEGLSISAGETSDFAAMLREVGSDLTPEEIDGFILDNCAARDMTFDRFFARAFPHKELEYADEAQETVFLNCLEERFEELSEHYDRVGDEKKAPLRSTIMELVEDRLDFLAGEDHEEEHGDGHGRCKCHALEPLYAKLDSILRQLNSETFDPGEEELDRIQAKVEELADKLEKIMDAE